MRMFLSWRDFQFSSSVCLSHFSGGRYKMQRGASFVGILDSSAEEPNSKKLRYVISGLALAAMLAGALGYFLRFTPDSQLHLPGLPVILGTEGLLQSDQELSDRERRGAAKRRQRSGRRCRAECLRPISQARGFSKICSESRGAALGRAFRQVVELSPAIVRKSENECGVWG